MNKRILCLDYGTKRIGVAISDPMNITAQPLIVLKYSKDEPPISDIVDLINEWNVFKIIVGLPKNLKGQESHSALAARELAKKIQQAVQIELEFWDERFSTLSVEKLMIHDGVKRKKRRQTIDKIAAAVILQSYLDYIKLKNKQNGVDTQE